MLFFDPKKIPPPEPIKAHSASQVKTFELCERLWTFQSIHKLRAPAKANLQLGSAIHKQIENWFLLGIEPPSPLAYAGIQNLPVRGSGLTAIEKPLDKRGPPDAEGKPTRVPALYTGLLPWLGFIDLLYQPLGVTDSVQVWDHKTTTNLMWAIESAKLKTDVQMQTYAKYAFDSEPSLQRVDLFHNYMVTSTMNQTEVRANHVTRAENAVVWQHIEGRAKEMQIIGDMALQSGDPNFWQRAKANYDSCSAFGGCAFRDLCDKHKPPTSSKGLYDFGDAVTSGSVVQQKQLVGENQMAASDVLKAKIAAAKGKVDGQPASAAQPELKSMSVKEFAATAAPAGFIPAATNVPAPPKQSAAMAMLTKKAQAAQTAVGAIATGTQTSGILPEDAPAQGPGIAAPQTMIENPVEDITDDASPAQEPAQAATETTEAPKKGRGRPKKGETVPEATPAGTVTPSVAQAALAAAAPPVGFTLCIGCSPVSGGAAPIALEFIIADMMDKAAKQAGVANFHVYDYGKKASLLTEMLKNYQFTASVYTFTTNDNFLEGIISQVLSLKAALVIRGVR